ncbi:hypothetical protein HDV00_009692, partial [Rhizophlyctis rosea]
RKEPDKGGEFPLTKQRNTVLMGSLWKGQKEVGSGRDDNSAEESMEPTAARAGGCPDGVIAGEGTISTQLPKGLAGKLRTMMELLLLREGKRVGDAVSKGNSGSKVSQPPKKGGVRIRLDN